MNIEKIFDFLKKDYNLSYKYQEFINCYGGAGQYKHIVFIMTVVVLQFIWKFKEEWIFGTLHDLARNAMSCVKEKLMFLQ